MKILHTPFLENIFALLKIVYVRAYMSHLLGTYVETVFQDQALKTC